MEKIEISIPIRCPQEKVFAFVTDIRNDTKWWKAVIHTEKTTEGPIGVGTRFRQTAKVMIVTVHNNFEIVEFDPPHHMRAINHSPELAYDVIYRFNSTGPDTIYTMIAQLEAKGVLRFLLPITLRVLKGQSQRFFSALKTYLETHEV